MRYCQRCILPDTRPGLVFDDRGNCNCATKEKKQNIDWQKRAGQFKELVQYTKSKSKNYDCLIPVSGGKDSTWQVVTCLEYGLKPLAVTWKTPGRTPLGQKNLDNLVSLGVDHIDYQINPKIEKKFMYKALVKYGTPALPMHMAMHAIPVNVALKLDIPLIVWGENSAFEYGSADESLKGFLLDAAWRKKFGVTHGTTAEDWLSDDLTQKDLIAYFAPQDHELAQKDIRAIFLGYYFYWSPERSLAVAKAHGFKERDEGPRTGYYNYADIDDDFISIHHYLKWYKFGFTRLFDNLSLEIREGNLSRPAALKIVQEKGDQTPSEDIKKLCKFLDITVEHFFEVIEKFRNRELWYNDRGTWKIRDFIIKDWPWQKQMS